MNAIYVNEKSQPSLDKVLSPLSETEFFETYWERSPVHIGRDDESHFAALLSVADIELLLSTQSQSFPSVQLTHSARPVSTSEYTDESRNIVAKQLVSRHHQGATLVISQAHEKFSRLGSFKADIQSALQLRCQTNVYLSPPDEQGFNPHYDSHDVFILQVAGSKTFNIYGGGVELPYSHESFQRDLHPCGVLQESIVLQPGDTLYIPRGVMHDAVAHDISSLHITLGIYPITLHDVMLEMVQRLGESDTRLRQSIPRSFVSGGNGDAGRAHSEAGMVCRSPELTEKALHQAVSTLLDDVAMETAQNVVGALAPTDGAQSVDAHSAVRLRTHKILGTESGLDGIRYRLRGQVIVFDRGVGEALQQLVKGDWLRVDQLSIASSQERLAVCRELINAGLLDVR